MAKKAKVTKEPKILRKLRPKDIMERNIRPAADDWGEQELFFIYGKANAVRYTDQGAYGDSWALKGQFEAERIEDGQRFMATECFLPNPMHDNIVQRFKDAQEKGEEMPLVEFAYKINIRQTASVVGYEYITIPIVQPAATEHLADLRSRMLENMGEELPASDSAQDPLPFDPDKKKAGGKGG